MSAPSGQGDISSGGKPQHVAALHIASHPAALARTIQLFPQLPSCQFFTRRVS